MIQVIFQSQLSRLLPLLAISLMCLSCSPAVQTRVEKDLEPIPQSRKIGVFKPNMPVPKGSERIGSIEIGDTGLSTGCSLNQVVSLAQKEARENGGHAIKLTRVKQPDMASTCYRIRADIYRFETFDTDEDTRRVELSRKEIKKYLSSNGDLDPIEGIWNYSSQVENKYSGRTTKRDNAYKIDILKRNLNNERRFDAVIISSDVEKWNNVGLVKARISSSAYSSLYEVQWIMANGTKASTDFKLRDEGLITANFDGRLNYVDARLVKQYPDIQDGSSGSEEGGKTASGTGFAISKEGLIVTNNHVVSNAKSIQVTFPGTGRSEEYSAEVLIGNKKKDISILEISDTTFSGFRNIPYSIGEKYSSGEDVFALGFPMSDVMGEEIKVTEGIISSTSGVKGSEIYLQTTVPVQPGNSGGPLFNMDGEVVGITTSTLNEKATGVDVENVNYSIKSKYLLSILNMVPEYKRQENTKNKKENKLPDMVDNFDDYICLIEVVTD